MKYFLLSILLFFQYSSFAQNTPDNTLRYQNLTSELRCLVCQNEDLSDSTAPLALDLKHQIQSMMAEGKSNEEIIQYLTARYGEFILFKPTISPKNYLLWFGPFILLFLGLCLFGFVLFLRKRSQQPSDLSAEEKAKLEELLK